MRLFRIAESVVLQVVLLLCLADKAYSITPTDTQLYECFLPPRAAIVVTMECLYDFDICTMCG